MSAMLMPPDGHHATPAIADVRCERAVRAAWPQGAYSIARAFGARRRDGQQAIITAKIFVAPDDKRWLSVSRIGHIIITPEMPAAEERAVFLRMEEDGNACHCPDRGSRDTS
ncbi:hypothetical protein [Rhizorhabdus argentea]|uniref:hypothetical protein n=1 Tax=Rhizorhabdus argentea TaxID=1387174 RepID=UPI0030EF8EBE